MSVPQLGFHELVSALTAEHDREVAKLRAEIGALKEQASAAKTASFAEEVASIPSCAEEPKTGPPLPHSSGVTLHAIFVDGLQPSSENTERHAACDLRAARWLKVPAGFPSDGKEACKLILAEDSDKTISHHRSIGDRPGTTQVDNPSPRGSPFAPVFGKMCSASGSGVIEVGRSNLPEQALTLRPVWDRNSNTGVTRMQSFQSFDSRGRHSDNEYGSENDGIGKHVNKAGQIRKGLGSSWIIPPNSTARIMWDASALIAIGIDLVTIPMQVFDPPSFLLLTVLEWMVRSYWTLDFPASFLTGYYHPDGHIELSPFAIAKAYIRTWFFPDVVFLATDWGAFIIHNTASELSGSGEMAATRLSRLVRFTRILRTLRLLRLLKMKRVVRAIQDEFVTEGAAVTFKITLQLLYVLATNHFVACAWYGVAVITEPSQGRNWLQAKQYDERTFGDKYATSMHWSIAQFSMGSMDVYPANMYERWFAISVLMFALVIFSGLVGSITSAMAQLRELATKRNRQMWLLRRFLRENKISKDLAGRIVRYIDYASEHRQQALQEVDVEILALLSDRLRDELQYEKHMHTLSAHRLFHQMLHDAETSKAMHRVCSTSISLVELIRHQHLFQPGELCQHMYFLTDGIMNYTVWDFGEALPPAVSIQVGDWACEAALWTEWFHVGELVSVTECRLLAVDSELFSEVASKYLKTFRTARAYAERFVERLKNLEAESITDLLHSRFSASELLREPIQFSRGRSADEFKTQQ